MGNFIRSLVVLVILVVAYWGWALAGAARLASAASRGDAVEVMQRVDLPALTHSLGAQIARAYLDQNPRFKKPFSVEGGFAGAIGAGAADAFLRDALTPQTIAALLSGGRGGAPDSGPMVWRMPPLGDAFRAGPLQALAKSRFDGPRSFVVSLDGAQGAYDVHFGLSGTTWRLTGLDIPEAVSARLAREIAQKVAGSAQRPEAIPH